MKKYLFTIIISLILIEGIFGYDKGLFDLDYAGNLIAYYEVIEIPSNRKPGLSSCENILKDMISEGAISSYYKFTLPQKGINAAFKVINDEGFQANDYNVYMISFTTYHPSISKTAVWVFIKFNKDGSAWFESYEIRTK